MSLPDLTSQVFSSEGALAKAAIRSGRGFQARSGQQDMALLVAQAIEQRTSLVVEAGTGVGKTFAYLVPAVLSGARVIVSTATKTLQDQLFNRDLPAVVDALGVPIKTALLKGRSSYLCSHRLEMHQHSSVASDKWTARALALVNHWASSTQTGDLAELTTLDERSSVIPLVTSTRENCLGQECGFYKSCYLVNARKEAIQADLVVVNHHLFFADMAVRESGVAQILPTSEVVIFDEAHQINEIGVGFLAKTLTSAQLIDFSRDVLAAGLQHAKGLGEWDKVVQALEYSTRDLRLAAGRASYAQRLAWSNLIPDNVDAELWAASLEKLKRSLTQAEEVLQTVIEHSPEFARLHERCAELSDLVDHFRHEGDKEAVRWLDVGSQLQLIESPLDIASAVQDQWFGAQAPNRSWVFTSATLGSDKQLSWFTQGAGLQGLGSDVLQIDRVHSPFDYHAQSALYVPANFPSPKEPHHSAAVAQVAWEAASALGGRTLVLTTTLRALKQIGEVLGKWSEDSASTGHTHFKILMQGQAPKHELIARFKDNQAQSILVASASFWEGVDIAGDALMCVVIDKLPFPPPDDPLVQARTKRSEREGKSSFSNYFMPEAAIALKQGTGRLIRSESDKGVLAVCDTRLTQAAYGRRLIAALPSMPVLGSQVEWFDYLAGLRAMNPSSATS